MLDARLWLDNNDILNSDVTRDTASLTSQHWRSRSGEPNIKTFYLYVSIISRVNLVASYMRLINHKYKIYLYLFLVCVCYYFTFVNIIMLREYEYRVDASVPSRICIVSFPIHSFPFIISSISFLYSRPFSIIGDIEIISIKEDTEDLW